MMKAPLLSTLLVVLLFVVSTLATGAPTACSDASVCASTEYCYFPAQNCGGPASGSPQSGSPQSGAACPASGAPVSGAPASGAPASGAPVSGSPTSGVTSGSPGSNAGICTPKKNNGLACGADIECKSNDCFHGSCVAVPTFLSATPINTDGTGTITITGGFSAATVLADIQNTQVVFGLTSEKTCTVTSVTGTQILANNCPAGSGGNYPLKVKIGSFELTGTISYAAPTVSSIQYKDAVIPCAGAVLVTLVGTNFGNTLKEVQIHKRPCTGAAYLTGSSFTKITCTVPPGIGSTANGVTVVHGPSDDHYVNSTTFQAVYESPVVTAVDPAHVDETSNNGGNFMINLTATCVLAEAEYSGWPYTIRIKGATITSPEGFVEVNPTSGLISFYTLRGVGYNNPVYVDLDGSGKFAKIDVDVSYPGPVVTKIVPTYIAPKSTRRVNSNSVAVTIYGTGFGYDYSAVITASVGGLPCSNVQLLTLNTILTCNLPATGTGQNLPVIVTVNGVSSLATNAVPSVRIDFANPGTSVCAGGSWDVTNTELCNCWSGNAPANPSYQVECGVTAVCPGKISASNTIGGNAPTRPKTVFKDDHLYISQTHPIVANRRDTNIRFAIPNLGSLPTNMTAGTLGAMTCNYPGPLWTKSVSQLDCNDEFLGAMPWSQNGLCGWVEDTSIHYTTLGVRAFKSDLVTTTIDRYKVGHTWNIRSSVFTYLMTVSFKKQITVFTDMVAPVAVNIQDLMIDVEIVGDTIYDVSSQNTLVQIATTVNWPYQIDKTTIAGTLNLLNPVAGGAVSVSIAPSSGGSFDCTPAQDTACQQAWVVTINNNAGSTPVCNIQGTVVMTSGTIECRDSGSTANCAFPNGDVASNFSLTISKTALCADAALEASKDIAYHLDSFFDVDHQYPQTAFQVGDMIYVVLSVSDTSTIDSITVTDVTISAGSATDPLYSSATPAAALSEFNLTTVTNAMTTPGMTAVTFMQFRLSRSILSTLAGINSLSNPTQTFTIEVDFDIAYHGNQKKRRSISSEFDKGLISGQEIHYISVYDDMGANDELQAEQHDNLEVEEDPLAWLYSGAAAGYTSVLAVVPVVVIAAVSLLL